MSEGILIVPGVRLRRNDDQNIVLEKWKEREDKPGLWMIVGHYPSVIMACNALTNHHMHLIVDEEGSIEELVEAIRKLRVTLKKTLKGQV